ncbi:hypothetical protein D3C81_2178000 [compost metagenome]
MDCSVSSSLSRESSTAIRNSGSRFPLMLVGYATLRNSLFLTTLTRDSKDKGLLIKASYSWRSKEFTVMAETFLSMLGMKAYTS